MLTDLIQERHLKWLGDVGCGDRELCLGIDGEWRLGSLIIPAAAASCILEHAIRVKLRASGLYAAPSANALCGIEHQVADFVSKEIGDASFDTEEEALIAAIDSLIEREKDEA